MAHIEIHRPHRLGHAVARERAEGVAADLRRRYGVHYGWEGDTLRVKGHGIDGALVPSDDGVRVTARLGLTALAFRRTLAAEIERELDRHLGPAPAPR